MNKHIPADLDSQPKTCRRCGETKPGSEFYRRSGSPHLLCSECKSCMRERGNSRESVPRTATIVPSERLAIQALNAQGIHAVPGKAVYYADVDVVAFGCVRIEVKYSTLRAPTPPNVTPAYIFAFSATQRKRGVLADVIMLVCDDGTSSTFHLFPAKHPVFFKSKRMKTAVTFVPGRTRESVNRVNAHLLTQALMDDHRDNWRLVWQLLKDKSDDLRKAFGA